MPERTCELTSGNLSTDGTTLAICDEPAYKTCYVCNRLYCIKHESDVEPDSCVDCLTNAANDIKVTEGRGNDESVGKIIEIVNDKYFVSTAKSTSEMSDPELDRMINTFVAKVRSLEAATDRTRITLSMMQMERQERFVNKATRLRGQKLPTISGNGVVSMPRRISRNPEKAEKAVKNGLSSALNISEEQLDQLLTILRGKKKIKKENNE
jgi:hypothetical protein